LRCGQDVIDFELHGFEDGWVAQGSMNSMGEFDFRDFNFGL
jgi:hypothetical protein